MHANLRSWGWVLSANFGEGLPYAIVNVVLVALLDDMGVDSGTITLSTGLLSLPWALKALWSPLVDTTATKRRWMLAMQLVLGLVFLLAAGALSHSWWLAAVLTAAGVAAVASATYDIACDGYYMLALPQRQQSFFVGIRSMAYRLGMLLATGGGVAMAGRTSWTAMLLATGALFVGLWLLHVWLLPRVEAEDARQTQQPRPLSRMPQLAPFTAFFQKPDLWFMLLFLFTYRLGEAFLSKVTILFLKAPVAAGGIGLSNEEYGLVYGTAGMLALTVGGIAGGMAISRLGLRRCILPMALLLNVPDLLYVWLASAQPSSLLTVGACVAFEQLGYGFGFTAYTVYLLQCATGPFRTSHYAFLTALMAIAMTIPTMLSGYALEAIGYHAFFIVACALTLPSFAMAFWYVGRTSGSSLPATSPTERE